MILVRDALEWVEDSCVADGYHRVLASEVTRLQAVEEAAGKVADNALALLWEVHCQLAPQPNGYRVKGSGDKAFALLMDNYDLTVKAGWDAKQRLAARDAEKDRALSRQTEALKACQERCAGVEATLAEEGEWCRRAMKAEAALKAMTEVRDEYYRDLQANKHYMKVRISDLEGQIASSRQRAERYRDALLMMSSRARSGEFFSAKYVIETVRAALADDKPQEPA